MSSPPDSPVVKRKKNGMIDKRSKTSRANAQKARQRLSEFIKKGKAIRAVISSDEDEPEPEEKKEEEKQEEPILPETEVEGEIKDHDVPEEDDIQLTLADFVNSNEEEEEGSEESSEDEVVIYKKSKKPKKVVKHKKVVKKKGKRKARFESSDEESESEYEPSEEEESEDYDTDSSEEEVKPKKKKGGKVVKNRKQYYEPVKPQTVYIPKSASELKAERLRQQLFQSF